MDNQEQTDQVMEQLTELKTALSALADEFHKNNFTAHQTFDKYSDFTTKLKVPHYASLPSTCAVGEIVESGGVLKICSAVNTWTTVGTQS